METNKRFVVELNNQIRRFGLHDSPTNCNGLIAYVDDGNQPYPPGCIRLDGDGGGETLVAAEATLRELAEVEPTGDYDSDQAAFYGASVAWDKTLYEAGISQAHDEGCSCGSPNCPQWQAAQERV